MHWRPLTVPTAQICSLLESQWVPLLMSRRKTSGRSMCWLCPPVALSGVVVISATGLANSSPGACRKFLEGESGHSFCPARLLIGCADFFKKRCFGSRFQREDLCCVTEGQRWQPFCGWLCFLWQPFCNCTLHQDFRSPHCLRKSGGPRSEGSLFYLNKEHRLDYAYRRLPWNWAQQNWFSPTLPPAPPTHTFDVN